jgi:hypothetical protein
VAYRLGLRGVGTDEDGTWRTAPRAALVVKAAYARKADDTFLSRPTGFQASEPRANMAARRLASSTAGAFS